MLASPFSLSKYAYCVHYVSSLFPIPTPVTREIVRHVRSRVVVRGENCLTVAIQNRTGRKQSETLMVMGPRIKQTVAYNVVNYIVTLKPVL